MMNNNRLLLNISNNDDITISTYKYDLLITIIILILILDTGKNEKKSNPLNKNIKSLNPVENKNIKVINETNNNSIKIKINKGKNRVLQRLEIRK